MQLHAWETLDEVVSPEPVIKNDKITVVANATADDADDLAAILDLPERLRGAINDLLDLLAIKSNACPVAVPPLTRYREHLDRYGPKPMLDSLNDRHAIVKDEYNGLRREKFFDNERGLRRAFLTFFALHKQFREAFAQDALREQAIRMYRLDPETLDKGALEGGIDAFEQGAKDALEAGVATPEFTEYAGELSGMMRDALRTPPPGPPIEMEPGDRLVEPIPNEKLWPVRWLLKGGAVAWRLVKLLNNPLATVGSLASLAGFLDSERGKKLMKGLRDIVEAIFGGEEGG